LRRLLPVKPLIFSHITRSIEAIDCPHWHAHLSIVEQLQLHVVELLLVRLGGLAKLNIALLSHLRKHQQPQEIDNTPINSSVRLAWAEPDTRLTTVVYAAS
jgi:hypothetical protein